MTIPGINIRWPITELILSGKKTVETRTYPIPKKYIGKELALIETPGKQGKFKARITGVITFGIPFRYQSRKEFYLDSLSHCITPESEWKWHTNSEKWGWPIIHLKIFKHPKAAPKKRGIRFTQNVRVSLR